MIVDARNLTDIWSTWQRSTWRRTTCEIGCVSLQAQKMRTSCDTSRSTTKTRRKMRTRT